MYEFTNGIVVFDEKTRDRYIEAGYRLVKKENTVKQHKEALNENTSNNGTIERKSKKCNKLSK
ncbi:MAG: hypothetical protein V8Q75_03270 [Bacilli bacterium]